MLCCEPWTMFHWIIFSTWKTELVANRHAFQLSTQAKRRASSLYVNITRKKWVRWCLIWFAISVFQSQALSVFFASIFSNVSIFFLLCIFPSISVPFYAFILVCSRFLVLCRCDRLSFNICTSSTSCVCVCVCCVNAGCVYVLHKYVIFNVWICIHIKQQ